MVRIGELVDDVLARAALVEVMREHVPMANAAVPRDWEKLPPLDIARAGLEFMLERPRWTLEQLAHENGDRFRTRTILAWLALARSREGLVVDGVQVVAVVAPLGDA